MQLKKIVAVLALSVLLASPCAASPWAKTLADFLDAILDFPLALVGSSEEEDAEEAPLPPVQEVPDSPGALTQTDGLEEDDPPTEGRGKIDVGG